MNNKIVVKKLNKRRFTSLVSHSRSPAADYISQETAWFSNKDESIIGVVLLDTVDHDFVSVVLGKDKENIYGTIDVQASIATHNEAVELTHNVIRWHTGKNEQIHTHDENKKFVDVFEQIVKTDKLHPFFVRVKTDSVFSSAKEIITKTMPHFTDIDGNYIEQFQTTGFDARLWELYLFNYLHEDGLFLDRKYHAPDYVVTKYGITVGIEAVTVGRKNDNPVRLFKSPEEIEKSMEDLEEMQKRLQDEIPIKFGSPLYSKLKKKYWELPHMSDNALVFALADFHDDASMTWTSSVLDNYLYGVKHEHHFEDGKLVIDPIKIEKHVVGDKEIPSGYFFQDDSENVSAVLFSSSATISKFNRMGKISGFGDPNIELKRVGTCYDHDPNATMPKVFEIKVTPDTCKETWAEGLIMYHNPNAKIPVDRNLFPSIAHCYFDDGQIVSYLPDFHPFGSFTLMTEVGK